MRLLSRVILAYVLTVPLTGTASAQPYTCRIGKPSYCIKYGFSRCERKNELGSAACEDWRRACFACHEPIAQCLGFKRTTTGDPLCETCAESWRSCMRAIDAAYWPNRLKE